MSITLGKENSSYEKIVRECMSEPHFEGIRLKVAEDNLKVMDIRHKMALLKCAELVSLR